MGSISRHDLRRHRFRGVPTGTVIVTPPDPGTGPVLARFTVINGSATSPIPAGRYVSLGHAFVAGDVTSARHVVLDIDDGGSGTAIPFQQYDGESNHHGDGSLNRASLGLKLPSQIAAGGTLVVRVKQADGAKSQTASSRTTADFTSHDYAIRVKIGGAWHRASLNHAIASSHTNKVGTTLVTADGLAFKEWRCASLFVAEADGTTKHPDLWLRFYARAHEDGATRRLGMLGVNGWMADGVNYPVDEWEFVDGSTFIYGESVRGSNARTWQFTYHTTVPFFEPGGDGSPYFSQNKPDFSILIDAKYARNAYAVWGYKSTMAADMGLPSQHDFSRTKTAGYLPVNKAGDIMGYDPYIGDTGDGDDRGDYGPMPSGAVAHMLTGHKLWRQYDLVQSLGFSMPVAYHEGPTGQGAGEIPCGNNGPFGTGTSYAALGPPRLTFCMSSSPATITNPAQGAGPAFAGAGGWHGTGVSKGGAFQLEYSHFPHVNHCAWLITGDWWHLDLALLTANGTIINKVGNLYRSHLVNGVQFWGLTVGNGEEDRGRGQALAELDNGAWMVPTAHPAHDYMQHLIDTNSRWWKQALTGNTGAAGQPTSYIPADRQVLGLIGGGFDGKVGTDGQGGTPKWISEGITVQNYHMDHLCLAFCNMYRRGRADVGYPISIIVHNTLGRGGFERGVFPPWNLGGCPYRAGASKCLARFAYTDPLATTYSQCYVADPNPLVDNAPWIPTGGCPTSGMQLPGGDGGLDNLTWWAGFFSYRAKNRTNDTTLAMIVSNAAIWHMAMHCLKHTGLYPQAVADGIAYLDACVPWTDVELCRAPRYLIKYE